MAFVVHSQPGGYCIDEAFTEPKRQRRKEQRKGQRRKDAKVQNNLLDAVCTFNIGFDCLI
jgi:hypothetical protein